MDTATCKHCQRGIYQSLDGTWHHDRTRAIWCYNSSNAEPGGPDDTNDVATHEALAHKVQGAIAYKDGYRLLCERDKADPQGRLYYQVECERPDIFTREMGVGRGGKAYLSPHMIESELVRLAFGLFRAYEEHECREWFQYRNRSVMGPHIDIDALWEAADRLDFRESM